MALGSKGDRDRNGGGGSGGRGRPYGVMLLLAFGAAVLGVMVLHKLRERRICTLLIKDKDHDLIRLQFLLQKERESVKEMKRKNEEMKAKANSLRTQKMELINKVAATQSVTSSLKEEQRVMETTLQEKQSELNSQIAALKELLKQKEDEIKEMKNLVEKPSKIWSVSSDDPSNRTVNFTVPLITNAVEMEKLGRRKVGEYSTKENEGNEEDEKGNKDKTEVGSVRDEAGKKPRLKNLGRSRMIVKSIANNVEDQNGSVENERNGDTNDFGVKTESGEKNLKLFEHSQDEGLREVVVEDGKVDLKGDDHEAGKKVKDRQQVVKGDEKRPPSTVLKPH